MNTYSHEKKSAAKIAKLFAVTVVIAAVLSGCGGSLEKKLVGTWEMEERIGDCVFLVSPIFYDNGTFSAGSGWSSYWKIVNGDLLQIQWSSESHYVGTETFQVEVKGDEMILRTSEEDYAVYKRMS